MQSYTIASVNDFISILSEMNIKPDIDLFRGHSNITYKLIPSIGRYFTNDFGRMRDFENDLMSEFRRLHTLYATKCNNEFELLFLAQHYGLPTRLLDWSCNPLVALYFAVNSNIDEDGCVYQRFPTRMLVIDYTKNCAQTTPYNIDANYLINPIMTHERYKNQNSRFVIYQNPQLEEKQEISAQFIIPARYKKQMLMFLRKIGISDSFIYPTMEGLCQDIKRTKLNLWQI